jgi:hypothetical protein
MAVSFCAVFLIKSCVNNNDGKSDGLSDKEQASFPIEYTDRLGGHPVTEQRSDSSTIEIVFGGFGYIRKTYAVVDNSGGKSNYTEKSETNIDGINVTFYGKNSAVYLATWNNNNFAYTISIDNETDGVSPAEMSEYVRRTR